MKIFFDCEFTGLQQNTTLISLGLIDENNRTFYAEFSDYDKSQCNDWIKENVLNQCSLHKRKQEKVFEQRYSDTVEKDTIVYGTKDYIKSCLLHWLSIYDIIEFVSDVCHYDFVLLIDLIAGHALKMPNNICVSCHDINQDIAKYYNISDLEAFNINREDIVKNTNTKDKHNSMHDAKIIQKIYEKVKGA